MSRVSEQHRKTGRFEIMFRDLPQEYQDAIVELGHIVITVAREDGPLGDHLLESARYTGVVLVARKSSGEYDFLVRGDGLSWWLGTADTTGPVIEEPIALADAAFDDAIRELLPEAITEGDLDPTGIGAYTGTHNQQSRREAIDYVCDTLGAEWRIRPNGELDAGLLENVFGAPQAVIVRRVQDAGDDMSLRAYPGPAQTDRDIEDYANRVLVLGRVEGAEVVTGEAELDDADIPYRDLFGNTARVTKIISESATEGQNATARAQAALEEFAKPQTAVTLTSGEYDLRDSIECGAEVWVWDPEAGMIDPANEITFRGQRINPMRQQVTMIDWPVTDKMGVYYRSATGEWLDVSRWVDPVAGQTNIEVGKNIRDLVSFPGASSPTGFVSTEPDTSVPNPPTLTPPFETSVEMGADGELRAQLQVTWTAPTLNTNGSAFVDGSHYEVRFRPAPFGPGTWGAAQAFTWGQLGTWGNPIPQAASDWETRFVPIDSTSTLLLGLVPRTRYEFQARAVDGANPPNVSVWSASVFADTGDDQQEPATPAAPEVAGALTQVSVKHLLGTDQGGTFNLDLDLAELEVYGSTEGPGFTPAAADLLGSIIATRAQIVGEIPVIGSFPVTTTAELWIKVVAKDKAGNRSAPSAAAAVTAELIPSQWVINLTADQITAGDFTATYGLVGLFVAGDPDGARFAAGDDGTRRGMMIHRPSGTLAIHGDANTGDLRLFGTDGTTPTLVFTASTGLVDMRGKLTAGASFTSGDRIVIDPDYVQPGGAEFPTVVLYSQAGTQGPARINATDQTGGLTALGLNSGPTDDDETYEQSTLFLFPDAAFLSVNASGGGSVTSDRRGGAMFIDKNAAAVEFSPSGTRLSGMVVDNAGIKLEITGSTRDIVLQANAGEIYLENSGGAALRLFSDGEAQLISNGVVKSFVIDHPLDPERLLVHACIEGPTADLIYRGETVIRGGRAVVHLPPYFEAAARVDGRQAQATPVGEPAAIACSDIVDGRFTVRCDAPDGTRVKWLATAIRADAALFEVEPRRDSVRVGGAGPYRFVTPLAA